MTGVALVASRTTWLDEAENLEEAVFHTARDALAGAGLRIEDVDSVAISGTDQVDGRVIEAMVTSGPVGAVGRDLTMVPSAAEHALIFAYLRLLAGLDDVALVLAWSKPTEGLDPERAELVGAEPFLLRPLGMNNAVAAGLQASAYRHRPSNGATDVVAWPLTRADLPTRADVVAAAVLTRRPGFDRPAYIRGAGWASDRYELGERNLGRFFAMETAAERAYQLAGVTADKIGVAEIQRISTADGDAAAVALGLDAAAGRTAINPAFGRDADGSGVGGLLRLLRAAAQVRGEAGPAQVSPRPSLAVGAGLHGFAGQGAAVVVFGDEQN